MRPSSRMTQPSMGTPRLARSSYRNLEGAFKVRLHGIAAVLHVLHHH